jgi:hypothetical protein
VGSVDGHHVGVRVPEAGPRGPNCIWSRRRRERVQRHLDHIPHPLRFDIQQDVTPQLGVLILWVEGGASGRLKSIRVQGHSP